jgi:hypothetical protein
MTYPAATRARRVACGVCAACESPGKPVAARGGATHQLAGLLCVEHLLLALGMPVEPPKAEAPPLAADVRAAFRASLRVHSHHDAAPSAVTAARQALPTPLEPEALQAALECMRQLGAVPLRTEPTYGVEPEPLPYVEPVAGVAAPDHPAMPAAARRMARDAVAAGWRVRVQGGEEWCSMRAARGHYRVDAHWAGGRFRTAWVATGAGCVKVGARQAAAILKASA